MISQRRKGAMFFDFVILRRGLEVLLFRSADSNARTRMSGQTTIGPGWCFKLEQFRNQILINLLILLLPVIAD